MFGMGIFEILVILVVAVIFLGPEKLPQAMIDIVKFFKAVKKTLNDAKDTFDKELHMSEIKKEALEYKNSFESSIDNVTKNIQLQEIDEMYGKYKEENQDNKALKAPKIPHEHALSYEEKPKKRGRPKKVLPSSETQDIPTKDTKKTRSSSKKSPSSKTSPDKIDPDKMSADAKSPIDVATKKISVTPKPAKSVGFKKSAKTSKEN